MFCSCLFSVICSHKGEAKAPTPQTTVLLNNKRRERGFPKSTPKSCAETENPLIALGFGARYVGRVEAVKDMKILLPGQRPFFKVKSHAAADKPESHVDHETAFGAAVEGTNSCSQGI